MKNVFKIIEMIRKLFKKDIEEKIIKTEPSVSERKL